MQKKSEVKSILFVSTIATTQNLFLTPLFNKLRTQGIRVIRASSVKVLFGEEEKLDDQFYTLPFSRDFNLMNFLRSFLVIRKIVAKEKPDIIYYTTPIASLCTVLASFGSRSRKIYHLRGIIASGKKGIRRILLITFEKFIIGLSDRVIINSESNKRYLIKNGVCSEGVINIPHNGSSHGVDSEKVFNPKLYSKEKNSKVTYGFVGRIEKDKGIGTLINAWREFSKDKKDVQLLLGGPLPSSWNMLDNNLSEIIKHSTNIVYYPSTKRPQEYYLKIDIFVFPSEREGFPNVVLEASAMGLPVITTRALGCVDSIINEKTGILFEAGNKDELVSSMERLYNSEQLRHDLGTKGRNWVSIKFKPEDVTNSLFSIIYE